MVLGSHPRKHRRYVGRACLRTVVCTDAGNSRHWMGHHFQTKRANSYFGTGGIGGVSWSMAAALAAQIIAHDLSFATHNFWLEVRRPRCHRQYCRPLVASAIMY